MRTMGTTWFADDRAVRRVEDIAEISRALSFTAPLAGGNTHEMHDGDRRIVNFSLNDYLALGEATEVREAAIDGIRRYGASTGASRLVSGEFDLHVELEAELASFVGAEAAMVLVSGHATNVTTLGMLFGRRDLVLHDQHAHNSMLEGIRLSGARRQSFRHNDMADLERRLRAIPADVDRVVVCVDGVYSMDGDIAPLRELVRLKHEYGCLLYVDDAHAVGTVGATGRGTAEHAGVDPAEIDVLMGTLGKALGSCGGFIAGDADLISHLRWTVPGYVFSAGLPAPQAAAALASLRLLARNPGWVEDLQARAVRFRTALAGLIPREQADLVTPIVPVLVDQGVVFEIAAELNARGIRVFPITFPAVNPEATRLRFSVNRLHGPDELEWAADALAEVMAPLRVAA